MLRTPRRRLEKLEQILHAKELAQLQQHCERIGAPKGITGARVMQELRSYLACPDGRMADFEARLSPEERQELAGFYARCRRVLGVRP